MVQKNGNGRFRPPGPPEDSRDPNDVFPFQENFCDCCGHQRGFIVSMDRIPPGYAVSATEEGAEGGNGYFFREFDPNCPYLALGRLRRTIRFALATRHLEEREPGSFTPLHDTLRGRVSYSSEEHEVAFVIDGRFLTLSQFAKIVEVFEGWQFRLDFLGESEVVR